MDYIMTFLMGLNDSFAQVRTQVLLVCSHWSSKRNAKGPLAFSQLVSLLQEAWLLPLRLISLKRKPRPEGHQDCNGKRKGHFAPSAISMVTLWIIVIRYMAILRGLSIADKIQPRLVQINMARQYGASANQISGSYNPSVGHSSGDTGPSLSQSFSKGQMEQLRVMFTQHLSSFENQHNPGSDSNNAHITGKDLHWYARDKKIRKSSNSDALKEEIRRIKEEEEQAMREALGLAPKRATKVIGNRLDKHEFSELVKRSSTAETWELAMLKQLKFRVLGFLVLLQRALPYYRVGFAIQSEV